MPKSTEPIVVPVKATISTTVGGEEETIATHIAAFLAAAGGTIALIHPGFHIPALVEELVTPISWAGAIGLEVFNLVTRRSLKKAIVGLLSKS